MNYKKSKKIILGIVILALGIRLISINQSLWMDESISAVVAKNFSLKEIITSFIASDTHPPLYYLLLRLWTSIFGFSEISLRFPSILFGVLTVFTVYKIGLTWNSKTGIYAGLLMAISPLHVYYSQEARMYSLTTLLVCLSVYYVLKKKWVFFSLSILFLGMSDYLPLVILAPLGIFIFMNEKYKKETVSFVLSLIPLITFLTIWFPIFKVQSVSTNNYLLKFPAWKSVLGSASFKEMILVWIKFTIGRIGFDNKLVYSVILAVPSSLYLLILAGGLKKFKKDILLWLWLVLPIIITFVASFRIPGFSYFRLLFTLPAFTLLLGRAITGVKHEMSFLILSVFSGLIFTLIYLSDNRFWREDWKTLVPFVENRVLTNEVVLVSYFEPFTPYLWYTQSDQKILTFDNYDFGKNSSLYTLDYLMDLTDPERKNYQKLVNLGFRQENIYNFRGVGQLRYWVLNK